MTDPYAIKIEPRPAREATPAQPWLAVGGFAGCVLFLTLSYRAATDHVRNWGGGLISDCGSLVNHASGICGGHPFRTHGVELIAFVALSLVAGALGGRHLSRWLASLRTS